MKTASKKFTLIAILVAFLSIALYCVPMALASDSQAAASIGHGEAHGMEAGPENPVNKILWGVTLSSISVLLFCIGGDVYAVTKAYVRGARNLWGWNGQWFAFDKASWMYIPERVRDVVYLTEGTNGYRLILKGHDGQGGCWGTVLCAGTSHPVGQWEIRPWRGNRISRNFSWTWTEHCARTLFLTTPSRTAVEDNGLQRGSIPSNLAFASAVSAVAH